MARINSYVLRGTIVGALGGLLFGFDTAVIAGTEQQLIQVFGLNDRQLGITVSIALVGTVIGAIFSGELGDKMGGREALRILAACYVVSAFGCAFAWSWPALLAFRFIGGLAIGGSSVLGPVYIAEIAPARWRGLLVGTFQINIVIGISGCVSVELCGVVVRLGHERVALAARHCRGSCTAVLCHAVHHPAQRALAGAQASHSRRPRSDRTSRSR